MTKYEYHGALHVNKGKLVDHNGEVVTLHGMSTHGLSWYPEYVNREFFEFMKKDWNIDVIRLAMYTDELDGYCVGDEINKQKLLKVIDDGVRFATELGLYVIIDWHILMDYSPHMYKDEAIKFFDYVSKKYKSYGNIIYEICNEPNMDCDWRDVKTYSNNPDALSKMLEKKQCEWEDIKAYADEVIPVIRANDPYSVILVGTPTWSQRVDEATANPITIDKNIMYVLHFYANTHKDELRGVLEDACKSGFPVFVSEFGTCSADGAGAHNTEEADKWIKLLDDYDVSYCMWNISNRDETSASFKPECDKYTNGFEDNDLRDPMLWYRNVLRERKVSFKKSDR